MSYLTKNRIENPLYIASTSGRCRRAEVLVHSIMCINILGYKQMLKQGNNTLNLAGISGQDLRSLYGKLQENGNSLKYNWVTQQYEIK